LDIFEWPRCSVSDPSRCGNGLQRVISPPVTSFQDDGVCCSVSEPSRGSKGLQHYLWCIIFWSVGALSFEVTLQYGCGDSASVPLASMYPQFSECVSMGDVISLSGRFA
jgi:hypothetical protein